MKKNIEICNNVIDLQIKALKKLKSTIDKSFNLAVKAITKCKSKILICGVGKSGKIASKISATLSSVGSPSFLISANDCSHGDLGRITNQDLLILISYSGNTSELINIIKYAKTNKIKMIGIVSNRDSLLYKAANIKILTPEVEESGMGLVPTSSTTVQLCLGDALAIAAMKQKKFDKIDFKKFHPGGNLGRKLTTVSEVMITKNKIPFVNENEVMNNALRTLNAKKLGFLVVVNNLDLNTGVFTDGDLKRLMQRKIKFGHRKIRYFMTKKPFSVEKNTLASDALIFMNKKKITNICIYSKENRRKTIGVVHIHSLISSIQKFKL